MLFNKLKTHTRMKTKLFTLLATVLMAANAMAQTTHEGREYVDLGLPSGTLWATCNVGATTPEQYGNYFAWGETAPKENYSWTNEGDYKWGVINWDDATNKGMTKYNNEDGLLTLEAADDAATANWGGKWRMPTHIEGQELIDECQWDWTTDYNGTGVAGYIVSSKAESNTNAIFLPATGYYDGTNLIAMGVASRYWFSSLLENCPDAALCLYFQSGGQYFSYSTARSSGTVVRPVYTMAYTITITPSKGGTVTGEGEYAKNATVTLKAKPNKGYVFVQWSDGNTDNPRTITVTQDSTLSAVFEEITPEYVDLGLPSGTLWATCNVGAATPERAGDHFAWGETEPKENYDWTNEGDYKWGIYNETDATNYGMTKYNNEDGLLTLEAADDAATVNWGGKWRMPTQKEMQELLDECQWDWTTDYNGTGKAGYVVTSKAEGNTNSIFLPAAGYYDHSYLTLAGSHGYYWSSSLDKEYPSRANALYFDWDEYKQNTDLRCRGYSVRPVQSTVYTITIEASEGGTVIGGGEYVKNTTAILTANSNKGYAFVRWSDGNTDNPRTIIVTQDSTFTAVFEAFTPEYVDLGLSVLWATCNVGAATPERAGDSFAWGETEPKEDYSWATLKYWDTEADAATKYTESDGLLELEAEDDAAAVNWGGDWRMPTQTEFQELIDECTWTSTTDYNGTGMSGYIVTSKAEGNTNSIFLPEAYSQPVSASQTINSGIFWSSSSVNSKNPNCLVIVSVANHQVVYQLDRYAGVSVRPVHPVVYTITATTGEGGNVTGGGEYVAGHTVTLTATPAEGYTFQKWSDGVTDNPRTITVTQDSTFAAKFAKVPEYVDLGLPSGTLWATFNVGANAPEQYGDYFAWGETEPKEDYSWATLKYWDTEADAATKYTESDGLLELEAADDAATVNWGGKWRTPTQKEMQELLDECTWTRTTDYNGTGKAGYIVTSKAEGNTNAIFLPAAGNRAAAHLSNVGSYGFYWSSSLDKESQSRAYVLYFHLDDYKYGFSNRYSGLSVRPVCSKDGILTGVQTPYIASPDQVRKVMENGQVIIIRDGVRYNILGAQVK